MIMELYGTIIATGLAIYTYNLRGDRPSLPLVWIHSLTAFAGIALVSLKVLGIGWTNIQRTLSVRKPQQAFSSLALLALGAPLVLTGALLLGAPSGHGALDYFHLIASVWWTVLFQWHLWRYLGRALGASLRRGASASGGEGAR